MLYALERMLWRCVFAALTIVFLTVLLSVVWDLLSPFLIGLAVAAALQPLIRFAQNRLHMRRGLAAGLWIALATIVALVLLYWFCSFAVVQLVSAAENAPTIISGIVDVLRAATNRLLNMVQSLPDSFGETIRTSLNSIYMSISDMGMQLAGTLINGAVGLAASLPYAFVYANFLLLAVIFITNRYEGWRQRLICRKGESESGRGLRLLKQSAGRGLAGYIRVQLLFSLLTCLISWVFFQTVGFQYAFLIGFVAALLEMIPQFGCGVLFIPWSVICFLVGASRNGWLVLGLYLSYSLLRRVTEPALLGTNLGVSPLASLVGMFVGMRMGGVVGLILGPIVTVVLLSAVRSHLFDGILSDMKVISDSLAARWRRGLKNG